jgi:hypothetical protein
MLMLDKEIVLNWFEWMCVLRLEYVFIKFNYLELLLFVERVLSKSDLSRSNSCLEEEEFNIL